MDLVKDICSDLVTNIYKCNCCCFAVDAAFKSLDNSLGL